MARVGDQLSVGIALALTLWPPTHASGQLVDPLDGLPALIDSVRSAWQVPGVAVAVVRNGAVVFSSGFGFSDLAAQLPVTPQTVFSIGSATKAFTAMTAALLVDEGTLDLDAPLSQLVPDFHLSDPCAERRATMRDLLGHRAGFPGYLDYVWFLSDLGRDEIFSQLGSLQTGTAFRNAFQYSNVGYLAAGAVMEKVTGVSWERLVTDRILRPLGMGRSGFSVQLTNAEADVALPYRVEGGRPRPVPFVGSLAFDRVAVLGPAGSLRSTLEDMTRWALIHLPGGRGPGHERLVSEAMLAEMHGPQTAIRDSGYRLAIQADMYGLGWALSDYRGHRVVQHGGNIEGFSALVSLMPDLDLGVVVLSNSMNLLGHVVSRNVYDRFLGMDQTDWDTPLRVSYTQMTDAYAQARVPPPPPSESQLPGSLEQLTGAYKHPAFGTVHVSASNDTLNLEFASGLRSKMVPTAPSSFWGTTDEFYLPQLRARFLPTNGRSPTELRLSFGPGTGEVIFRRSPAGNGGQ